MNEVSQIPRGWIGSQVWRQLLFAHFPGRYDNVRSLVPDAFEIDRYEGDVWVGVVPFVMSGVRFRGFPAVPHISSFLELNLRTYVTYRGQRGVYFFSLDANRKLAVWAARTFFHLPYYRAAMQLDPGRNDLRYRSQRMDRRGNRAGIVGEFDCNYRGMQAVETSRGDLVDWLTERYSFFTVGRNRGVYRGDLQHAKWPLQVGEADMRVNTLAASIGVDLCNTAPLLHYAERVDVRVWPISKV